MNYYRIFAARAVREGTHSPFVWLIAVLFALLGWVALRVLGEPTLAPRLRGALAEGFVLYGLSFVGYISVFMYSQRVFYSEKKARTLVMTFCSPAGLREVFLGKLLGVVAGGFLLPLAVALPVCAAAAPAGLAALANWNSAAAFLLALGGQFAFAACNGMFMLSVKDERALPIMLYGFSAAQAGLLGLAKLPKYGALLGGTLGQQAFALAGLLVLAGAAYGLFFSKMRVLESI